MKLKRILIILLLIVLSFILSGNAQDKVLMDNSVLNNTTWKMMVVGFKKEFIDTVSSEKLSDLTTKIIQIEKEIITIVEFNKYPSGRLTIMDISNSDTIDVLLINDFTYILYESNIKGSVIDKKYLFVSILLKDNPIPLVFIRESDLEFISYNEDNYVVRKLFNIKLFSNDYNSGEFR